MKKPVKYITDHTVKTERGTARLTKYPTGDEPFGLNKNTRRIRKEEKKNG